jgi:dTDP-4-dehydrorhamnose 3,5-epimerase-like enzyme
VLVIEPDAFEDERGSFMESWSERRCSELGVHWPFVQDNYRCTAYYSKADERRILWSDSTMGVE